ncbi:MAG: type II toxin-antitoxin system RelE/ParE family toxin [Patescibacteria group bacterium]|jgi:mRNA interferase RelE/StbE
MLRFDFTKAAKKELDRLPADTGKRIVEKIIFYCSQSEPLRNAKHLSAVGGKIYRFRIGDYRVVFEAEKNGILITKVEHRGNIYKRMLFDVFL